MRTNLRCAVSASMVIGSLFMGGCGKEQSDADIDRQRVDEENCKIKEIVTNVVAIPGRNFKMMKTEVTQGQWESVMGANPSHFRGEHRPVENVSCDDVQEFIDKLNGSAEAQKGKVKFRLPTDEEWVYACRAGATGVWGKRANGEEGSLDAMGWYFGNSGFETHPVAQKEPNAWGLYDMHGNVEEWTSTAVAGTARVVRGGCWSYNPGRCAIGDPLCYFSGKRSRNFGFRLVSEDL